MIVLIDSDPILYANRFYPGKNRSSGITFFLRVIPISLITGQIQLDLTLLQLGLLHTEAVRIQIPEHFFKPFANRSAKSVYVP